MSAKRHHFVPELLLKRFADRDGRLFFFDHRRAQLGVRRSTPSQLFCETHLYSKIENNGDKDPSLERTLSVLESRTEPIIHRTVVAARQNRTPRLSFTEKADWDQYLLMQWKRVPDVHTSVPSLRDIERDFDKILKKWSRLLPHKRVEIDALRSPDEMRRFIHNAKVGALDLPAVDARNALARRGLAIIRITHPNESFVIGSFPVVKLTLPGRTHLLDPAVEMWLPVAHDVALGIGREAGTELFMPVSDPMSVRHLNEAVVRQSTMFAGCSEALVASLGRSGWKPHPVGIVPERVAAAPYI